MGTYIPDRLRLLVAKRAQGYCEYCHLHEEDVFLSFQIDHIISLKHGGETHEANLAWTCFSCNNNKGSDIGTILFPENLFIRLFNPRIELWEDHFEIIDYLIHPKSLIAEATIKVLQLNEVERIMERQIINR